MLYAAAFCEASLLYISSPLHVTSLVKDSSIFHDVYPNFSLVWQYNPIVSENSNVAIRLNTHAIIVIAVLHSTKIHAHRNCISCY